MAYLKNLWRFIVNGFRVFGEASRGQYNTPIKEVEEYKQEFLQRDVSELSDAANMASDRASIERDVRISWHKLTSSCDG
ncbi:MAG: hypothetical protein ACTTH9_00735 [Porphyromonas gingivalis]|uniref:Uncharacterized protein n=2 Tax=root TaxID=1 RepID=A0A0E2LM45_PORGN|nr:hypothetical protein [Porphyromonas gingivalis]ERJ63665.1 hypothetical protein HMPREF1555_02322 [Porphyromonas gingivalis F0570]